jgi:hypothetical protein
MALPSVLLIITIALVQGLILCVGITAPRLHFREASLVFKKTAQLSIYDIVYKYY